MSLVPSRCRAALFGWLALALLGCGGSSAADDRSGPAGFDPGAFSNAVSAANRRCPPGNCALAVHLDGGPSANHGLAERIAGRLGVDASVLMTTDSSCGEAGQAACASQFQHDLFKGDGCRGTALDPLAQELEAAASDVTVTIWTGERDGTSLPPVVSLAGQIDQSLVGIAFFFDATSCP